MRLIRLKLGEDVKTVLRQLALDYNFQDQGIVEDIFSLLRLKGNGIPTVQRVSDLAKVYATTFKKNEAGVGLLLQKRRILLKNLVAIAVFHALAGLPDAILACRRLIQMFLSFYSKERQAQCLACSYLSSCQFGQRYGKTVLSISKVIDSNYGKLVHPQCPAYPEISAMNKLYHAMESFQATIKQLSKEKRSSIFGGLDSSGATSSDSRELTSYEVPAVAEDGDSLDPDTLGIDPNSGTIDPDQSYELPAVSGAGKKDDYDNQHTCEHICAVSEKFVEQVTKERLVLFELARKLDIALDTGEGKSFEPVPYVSEDRDQEQIKSEADLPKVSATAHALPRAVFDQKLNSRELIKDEFQEPQSQKQLLYVLIDSSYSMSGFLGGRTEASNNLFTRGSLATVFASALARKIRKDKGVMFVRFFAGNTKALLQANEEIEFDALISDIMANNYHGGGTNIPLALETAVSDITKAQAGSNLSISEVLIITDCEDPIDHVTRKLEDLAKQVPIHVLDVAGESVDYNKILKSIAKKYYKVKESNPDVAKMISEVI